MTWSMEGSSRELTSPRLHCPEMRTSRRHPSRLHTRWNFLDGGSCWEAGSGPSLEACKPMTEGALWGCCRRPEVICVTRHQTRWPPSSLAVLRTKGPTNSRHSSVQSPWRGWSGGPSHWLDNHASREPARRAAIHRAENAENSGAHKDSTLQSSSTPSAYRNQPHRQFTRKNEGVNPGWGGRNHKAVLLQEINQC